MDKIMTDAPSAGAVQLAHDMMREVLKFAERCPSSCLTVFHFHRGCIFVPKDRLDRDAIEAQGARVIDKSNMARIRSFLARAS